MLGETLSTSPELLFTPLIAAVKGLKKEVAGSQEKWIIEAPKLTNNKESVFFDYQDKNGQKWEIVCRKEWDNYSVRVKKRLKWANWQEWRYTQKNWEDETFNISANDVKKFNVQLWSILDIVIWAENRDRLPKTWWTVYSLLNPEDSTSNSSEKVWEKTNLKEKPIELKYKEINKEKNVQVNYPSNQYSVEWRITRCLRRSSITDAVEDRYWIPRWLLMALMAQEWWWDPTVINQKVSKDPKKTCDWGAWLIHMQAINAKNFGLKTLPTYVDEMIDYQHWERLEQAKREAWNDLAKLSELDDRFNPVLSVDASARFLINWYKSSNWIDARVKAINTYAWRWMNDYWYAVIIYWQTIASIRWFKVPSFSREIEKVKSWKCSALVNWRRENIKDTTKRTMTAINNLSPIINGKTVNYETYCKYIESQCENYWLTEYKKNNKLHPYVK